MDHHQGEKEHRVRAVRFLGPGLLVTLSLLLNGCAAWTNPTALGVPVDRLPPHLLGRPREDAKPIPLTLLQQTPPTVYRLDTGDVLGIWIEGVLGERNQPVPVQTVDQTTGRTVMGYPIPVREDGTIALPLVPPLQVRGKTLVEVEQIIREAYSATKEILKPGTERLLVELQQPRRYHILVIRQDSGNLTVGQTGLLGSAKRGTGYQLDLPAYRNDLLNALARTGGFPGLDAKDQVFIERGDNRLGTGTDTRPELPWKCPDLAQGGTERGRGQIIRIPLRLYPGEEPPFRPEDIILHTGDIVYIQSRDSEVFYTGGLLGSGQYVLPRDIDLDVVDAVCMVKGPLVSGGIGQNNLTGNIVQTGLGFPSPSLVTILRRTAGRGQVVIRVDLNRALVDARERILIQPKDTIILQETLAESLVRYITTIFKINFSGTILNQRDATATTTIVAP